MNLPTLAGFLVGHPQSILAIAMDRRSPYVGAFLVFTATIVRQHDSVSLIHEPWRVLSPILVSTLAATILFWVIYPMTQWRRVPGEDPPMPNAKRGFLILLAAYWMTAPIAWLHAIPLDALFTEVGTARGEAATSLLVVAWRTALMVRIVNVVFGTPLWATAAIIVAFADALALVALTIAPAFGWVSSGGVVTAGRVLEDGAGDDLIARYRALAIILTASSLPIWLIASGFAVPRMRPWWRVQTYDQSRRLAWIAAPLLILACAGLLSIAQPAQAKRERIERLWARGDHSVVLDKLSRSTLTDYPPNWQPPPRPRAWTDEQIRAVMQALTTSDPAPWVRDTYLRKLDVAIRLRFSSWPDDWPTITDAAFANRLDLTPKERATLRGMLDFLVAHAHPVLDGQARQMIRQTRDAIR